MDPICCFEVSFFQFPQKLSRSKYNINSQYSNIRIPLSTFILEDMLLKINLFEMKSNNTRDTTGKSKQGLQA